LAGASVIVSATGRETWIYRLHADGSGGGIIEEPRTITVDEADVDGIVLELVGPK
jgi:hypothetical protein